MIESDPLDRARMERRMRLRRDARREALRLNAIERSRIENELKELDDAIVGLDHMQMEDLRRWSKRLDDDTAQQQAKQDDELDKTFPASDVPGHLAPGSQA